MFKIILSIRWDVVTDKSITVSCSKTFGPVIQSDSPYDSHPAGLRFHSDKFLTQD